jgi:hypothetical protein
MRVSSRSFNNVPSILVLVGTGALLVLLVVLITGGFVIDAGPLHVSSHNPTTPLVVGAAAWVGALLAGRWHGVADAAEALGDRIDLHAPALAMVIAAAATGTGIAFNTYAASASDASGYVSQSQLLAAARVSRDEPLARVLGWTNAEWALSPLGYRPGAAPGEIVPTYPPRPAADDGRRARSWRRMGALLRRAAAWRPRRVVHLPPRRPTPFAPRRTDSRNTPGHEPDLSVSARPTNE